jgi:hypothetical protein
MAVILSLTEILKGYSNLVFVIIAFIVGIKLIIKYPKYKDINFLHVGLTWMGIVSPYLATTISFLYTSITGQLISIVIYLIINITFFPISLFLWMMAFTNLAVEGHKKSLLIITGIYTFLFEIIFFLLLVFDPSLLGTMIPPFIPRFELFIIINYLIMLLIFIITGIFFSYQSIKATSPNIKLKGKFLLIAFILVTLGGLLDLIPTPDLVILFKRSISIAGSLMFYLGFYLPNFVEKAFIKQE